MSADDLFKFKIHEKVRTCDDDVGAIVKRYYSEDRYLRMTKGYDVELVNRIATFAEASLDPYFCRCPHYIPEKYRQSIEELVHLLVVNGATEDRLFEFTRDVIELVDDSKEGPRNDHNKR